MIDLNETKITKERRDKIKAEEGIVKNELCSNDGNLKMVGHKENGLRIFPTRFVIYKKGTSLESLTESYS